MAGLAQILRETISDAANAYASPDQYRERQAYLVDRLLTRANLTHAERRALRARLYDLAVPELEPPSARRRRLAVKRLAAR